MKQFLKFIPFAKIDEAKREVSGIVTAEVEDKDGETCDYDSTAPYYKAWSGELAKATDGENLGNLREMHGLAAAGKGTAIEFQSKAKQIWMCFKVVDDGAWKKVKEKVYTGFSHGGEYVKQWIENGVHYYTANPAEVSLVDNPCLPVAYFETVKADGARSLCKRVGKAVTEIASCDDDDSDLREEILALNRRAVGKAKKKTKRVAGEDLPSSAFAYVGDPEDTSTWKLPIKFSEDDKTKSHIRNALARFDQTQDIPADEKEKVRAKIEAAAKKHGIEVSEDSQKAVEAALIKIAGEELAKGMYEVGRLADVLQQLAYLVASTSYERDYEQDDSEVPDELRERLEDLVAVFMDMADEETKELTAAGGEKGGTFLMTTTAADLAKAASIHGHLKKAIAAHGKMVKAHEEMGGHLQDCMKAMGHDGAEEDAEKALTAGALEKAISDVLVKAGIIKAAPAAAGTGSVEDAVVAALVKAGVLKAAEPTRDPNAPATVADVEKTVGAMLKALFGKDEPAAAAPAVVQGALPGVQAPVIPITKAADNGGVVTTAAAATPEFVPGADPRNGDFLKFAKTLKPTDPPSNVVAALPAHRA